MKNAINYFDGIQPFYKGNKVLILGQIADLGDSTKQIHRFVQEELNQSAATHIYGYGEHFKLLLKKDRKQMIGFNGSIHFRNYAMIWKQN